MEAAMPAARIATIVTHRTTTIVTVTLVDMVEQVKLHTTIRNGGTEGFICFIEFHALFINYMWNVALKVIRSPTLHISGHMSPGLRSFLDIHQLSLSSSTPMSFLSFNGNVIQHRSHPTPVSFNTGLSQQRFSPSSNLVQYPAIHQHPASSSHNLSFVTSGTSFMYNNTILSLGIHIAGGVYTPYTKTRSLQRLGIQHSDH